MTSMTVTMTMTTPLTTPLMTTLSSAGRPQPDNREAGSDEACMAVLNDFYGDGEAVHIRDMCVRVTGVSYVPYMSCVSYVSYVSHVSYDLCHMCHMCHTVIYIVSGIKWHDVACHHEKPVICEDEPGHLNFVLGGK